LSAGIISWLAVSQGIKGVAAVVGLIVVVGAMAWVKNRSLFFLFVVVDGDLLQILGFENLVAFDATQVIDPIPPHQELSALVLTGRHTRCRLSLF
jgi:hypothetical protein